MRHLAITIGLSMTLSMLTACGDPAAPPPATPATETAIANVPDPLVGHAPPDFTAKTQTGAEVHLAALKGKPVVVYFYPKDETPGCTTEACAFRDGWSDLEKAGVVLIGVSADNDDSHRAFADHHKLPFLLVSDPDGKIAGQFGVPFKGGHTSRQSFVVGANGNVVKVYRKVDVGVHAKEIHDDVSAASATSP